MSEGMYNDSTLHARLREAERDLSQALSEITALRKQVEDLTTGTTVVVRREDIDAVRVIAHPDGSWEVGQGPRFIRAGITAEDIRETIDSEMSSIIEDCAVVAAMDSVSDDEDTAA